MARKAKVNVNRFAATPQMPPASPSLVTIMGSGQCPRPTELKSIPAIKSGRRGATCQSRGHQSDSRPVIGMVLGYGPGPVQLFRHQNADQGVGECQG